MSIITISRRPFSRGKEVAEAVARKLNYKCIAREVLFDAAKRFDLHDTEILRAIHDAPSFSDHFLYGRERYVAFFQAVLLEILQQDNVVYHGLAGHFFVQCVSHVLKVRIITGMDERVRILAERESIDAKRAARFIKSEDRERRKWSRHLYGMDTWDPRLYDLVLNIKDLSIDEAAEIIVHTVNLEHFQSTPESKRKLDDLVLSSQFKAALIQTNPDVEVHVENGSVLVKAEVGESEEANLYREIEKITKTIPNLVEIKIKTGHSVRHYD